MTLETAMALARWGIYYGEGLRAASAGDPPNPKPWKDGGWSILVEITFEAERRRAARRARR